jgi:hypothetical protein
MHAMIATISCLALLLPAAALAADEAPKRKPGLWEIETQTQGMPSPVGPIQICVGENSDDLLQQSAGDMNKACEKSEMKRDGDKITVKSVCKFGQTTATTEGVYTGNFDLAYRADLHTTYDPPMRGMKESGTTLTAKWTGPCKAGQKPGDIVIQSLGSKGGAAGPKTLNMEDMMKTLKQMQKMQGR